MNREEMREEEQPTCAICGQTISIEEHNFCLANPTRFNDQTFCHEHQRRFSACRSMRWQPGRGRL